MGAVMKKLVLLFLFLAVGARAQVYVAQTAGTFSGGTACNGKTTVVGPYAMNSPGTVYVCGTVTGTAGSTWITANSGASGTSSALSQIIFDTGATLSAPYWGSNGAIYLNGVSNLTVNGQNGTIQATANGSPEATCISGACSSDVATSNGILVAGGGNIRITALTIANIYVAILNGTGSGQSSQGSHGVYVFPGTNNLRIDHCTIHDVFAPVMFTPTQAVDGISIDDNETYNANWQICVPCSGALEQVTNLNIYNNKLHDWGPWVPSGGHHDGIFTFAYSSSQPATGNISGNIYNNIIYGTIGSTDITAMIYNSWGSGVLYIFNNVLYNSIPGNGYASPGYYYDYGVGDNVFNNTIVGLNTSGTGGNATAWYGTGATMKNNLMTSCYDGSAISGTATAAIVSSDYNIVYGCNGWNGTYFTLGTWQAATGYDAHSSNANPNLNASSSPPYQLNGPSGAAYRTGANLTSICVGRPNPGLGALCYDALGNARPATGAWDIGAYQYQSGASTGGAPNPPSGLTATVN